MALEILFNKEVPNELYSLLEWIDESYDYFKENDFLVDWKVDKNSIKYQRKWEEYGFYIFSTDKKLNMFVGIWFSLWREKNKPFCFSMDFEEDPIFRNQLETKITRHLSEKSHMYENLLDYKGYPTITLIPSLLCSISDYKFIVKKVLDIAEAIDMKLKKD